MICISIWLDIKHLRIPKYITGRPLVLYEGCILFNVFLYNTLIISFTYQVRAFMIMSRNLNWYFHIFPSEGSLDQSMYRLLSMHVCCRKLYPIVFRLTRILVSQNGSFLLSINRLYGKLYICFKYIILWSGAYNIGAFPITRVDINLDFNINNVPNGYAECFDLFIVYCLHCRKKIIFTLPKLDNLHMSNTERCAFCNHVRGADVRDIVWANSISLSRLHAV